MTSTDPEPPDVETNVEPVSVQTLRARRDKRASLLLVGGIGLVIMALVWVSSNRMPQFSSLDEHAHFDWVEKISRGHLLARGETLDQRTMSLLACRGLAHPEILLPPCTPGENYDPALFPASGVSYLDHHPPTYYAITSGLRDVLDAFGIDDPLLAIRLISGLWLSLGLFVLWKLAEEFRIPAVRRVPLLLLCALAPAVLVTGSIVGPDATAIVVGSGVALAVVKWERREWPGWVPVVLSFGATALKATHVTIVALLALYLVLRSVPPGPTDQERASGAARVRLAGSLLLASLAAILSWALVRSALAQAASTPILDMFRGDVDVSLVLDEIPSLVTPLNDAPLYHRVSEGLQLAWMEVLNVLLIAGCFGTFLIGRATRPVVLGRAAAITMVASGPALAVGNALLLGVYFSIPSRYGLTLVPALFIVIGALGDRPVAEWMLRLLAGAMLLSTAIYLLVQ